MIDLNRPLAMGWQLPPAATGCHPFSTPENFLAIFCLCFIIIAKERSSYILVEISLGLCNLQENSISYCIHSMHLNVIAESMK